MNEEAIDLDLLEELIMHIDKTGEAGAILVFLPVSFLTFATLTWASYLEWATSSCLRCVESIVSCNNITEIKLFLSFLNMLGKLDCVGLNSVLSIDG